MEEEMFWGTGRRIGILAILETRRDTDLLTLEFVEYVLLELRTIKCIVV